MSPSTLRAFTCIALLLVLGPLQHARATEQDAWDALRAGGIALFRHANAPGVGDPATMRLGDCATQRNLDEAGREQARQIGMSFTSRRIAVSAVLSSQWCRAMETATLAFPQQMKIEPVFNSFFANTAEGPVQTAAARNLFDQWQGAGALVVFSHQVNITALTGIVPRSGEGVVLRRVSGAWQVAGRLMPR